MKEGHREFLRSLSREERVLIHVRDVIYEGDWEEIERDLRARLEGRPYIVQFASRIEDDLERIERLRRFEAEEGVDVGALLREFEAQEERDNEEGDAR